jgi:tetratricopeptide (TPR) repeat protein
MSEYEHARRHVEIAQELYATYSDEQAFISAQGNLAAIAFYQGHYNRSIELFEDCRVRSDRVGDRHFAAKCLGNVGSVSIRIGDVAGAEERLALALSYAQSQNDILMEAESSSNLSVVKYKKGEVTDAVELTRRAKDLAAAIGNQAQVMASDGLLGSYLAELCRYEEALTFSRLQRATATKLGDQRQQFSGLINEAGTLIMLQRTDEAGAAIREARSLAVSLGNRRHQTLALLVQGKLRLQQRDFMSASELYRKSLNLAQENGYPELALRAQFGIGDSYRRRDQCARAGRAFRSLIERSAELDNSLWHRIGSGYLGLSLLASGEFGAGIRHINAVLHGPADERITWHSMYLRLGLLCVRLDHKLDSAGEVAQGRETVHDIGNELESCRSMPALRNDPELSRLAEVLSSRLQTSMAREPAP